jgi:putative transposase
MIKQFTYKVFDKPKNAKLHRLVNLHGVLYNHCIALHKRYTRLFGKHVNQFALMRHIAKLKGVEGFEWISLMGSQSVQDVVKRIEKGYALFFSENKKGNKKIKPPTFRKIKKYRSFTLTQAGWKLVRPNVIRIDGRTHKFALSRPIEGRIKTVTIKRDAAGDFWVAFACEVEAKETIAMTGKTAGVDFGLKTFLTFSDGRSVHSPQFTRQGSKSIAKASRELARKVKESKSRSQAMNKLARIHRTVARKRDDWQWKEARKVVEQFDTVWIEDLNLRGMKALWGRKVSDLAFYAFTCKLEYLLTSNGKTFGKRDRFFASSKTHFECGYVFHDLKLSDREWLCQCGQVVERDHNAAKMIEHGRAISWSGVGVSRTCSATSVDTQESPSL